MVRRFFWGVFGDYHVFSFFWDGKECGTMATFSQLIQKYGRVLILLP